MDQCRHRGLPGGLEVAHCTLVKTEDIPCDLVGLHDLAFLRIKEDDLVTMIPQQLYRLGQHSSDRWMKREDRALGNDSDSQSGFCGYLSPRNVKYSGVVPSGLGVEDGFEECLYSIQVQAKWTGAGKDEFHSTGGAHAHSSVRHPCSAGSESIRSAAESRNSDGAWIRASMDGSDCELGLGRLLTTNVGSDA